MGLKKELQTPHSLWPLECSGEVTIRAPKAIELVAELATQQATSTPDTIQSPVETMPDTISA